MCGLPSKTLVAKTGISTVSSGAAIMLTRPSKASSVRMGIEPVTSAGLRETR